MELAPAPNLRNARTRQLADEFLKRSGGRPLDALGGYAHEAILVIADALQRAGESDPEAIAAALRATSFPDPLMVAAGPVTFDATGENPNASPAVLQVFGGRPTVVWPADAAERAYVLAAPGS
jgi:branched-chain amino acid transport system substrate-binding protein